MIAASLGCATFNLPFVGMILGVALIGLIILKFDKKLFRKKSNEGIIIVKVPSIDFDKASENLLGAIKSHLPKCDVDSIIDEESYATLTYKFSNFCDTKIAPLRSEIKNVSSEASMNIFYHNNAN